MTTVIVALVVIWFLPTILRALGFVAVVAALLIAVNIAMVIAIA